MSQTNADRHLLFGILALQNGLIHRDGLLSAFDAWIQDKSKSIDDVLVANGALSPQVADLLRSMVAVHVQHHGNDPAQSLAALSAASGIRHDLRRVSDEDVQRSLARVARGSSDEPSLTTIIRPDSGERFRILRPHARGGLGEVSVALDRELNREIALKEIQDRFADDKTARQRFVLEAEITGGLEHPGIVPVYAFGAHDDGRPFYAMKFIRGDSLQEAAAAFHSRAERDFQSVEFRSLLQRFIDVCNAMAYAHARGVLHRDLKPGNIMLGNYGETLVVDWGLAKAIGTTEATPTTSSDSEKVLQPSSGSSSETLPGEAIGTPAYMSPEQAAGRLGELSAATDVYSLGATLYQVVTGEAAFKGPAADVLAAVQKGRFTAPQDVVPRTPRALNAIVLKAMALKPSDRYPGARDLASDLEAYLAEEPVYALPEKLLDRVNRFQRKNRSAVQVAMAASLLLAAGASAAAWVIHGQSQANALLASEKSKLADEKTRLAESESAAKKKAQDAAEEADREATNAEALASILLDVFKAADPIALGDSGLRDVAESVRSMNATELLKRIPQRIETNRYPTEVRARMLDGVGDALRALGDVESAEPLLKAALAAQDDPESRATPADRALLQFHFGLLHHDLRELEVAEPYYLRALVLINEDPKSRPLLRGQIEFRHAWLLAEQKKFNEAEAAFLRVKQDRLARFGALHPETQAAELGAIITVLPRTDRNEILKRVGELDSTASLMVELIKSYIPARVARDLKNYTVATAAYENLLKTFRANLPPRHPILAMLIGDMAGLYRDMQQFDRAFELGEEALDIARHTIPTHPYSIDMYTQLAEYYRRQGKPEKAAPLLKELLGYLEKRNSPGLEPTVADIRERLRQAEAAPETSAAPPP